MAFSLRLASLGLFSPAAVGSQETLGVYEGFGHRCRQIRSKRHKDLHHQVSLGLGRVYRCSPAAAGCWWEALFFHPEVRQSLKREENIWSSLIPDL